MQHRKCSARLRVPRRPRARARIVLAAPVALAIVFHAGAARAELNIKWDCYLPSGAVDCALLESSLTAKIPFVRPVSDSKSADVRVSVTSVSAEDGTRFLLDFVGRRVDGYAPEIHTTDKIPSTIDATTATVRVMTKLQRGLGDFMDQKIAGEVEGGELTLRLADPTRSPQWGRTQQSGVKWYLAPVVGTYFSSVQGVGVNAAANASVSFNYSARTWRAQQWLGASFSQQSQPVPGTDETASVRFAGANAGDVLSWSLSSDQRWNLGVLLGAEKNPQGNYRMRINGSVGLEFDVVPRQTVHQKNFGFRCAIGPESHVYEATNVEGLGKQVVARQFCDVYLGWHFTPFDVWAGVGETTILKNVAYRAVSASLSATLRITENLSISPWFSVQQVQKAINEAQPSAAVYATPKEEIEASLRTAAERGYTAPLSIQSGLSIRYLFGNGSLNSEDQRWKGTVNLR